MTDHKSQGGNAGMEDDTRVCQSLCWVPIVMLFLCFSLGICCLFFMSTGGLVLCILHFVLGSIFLLIPYGVYQMRGKSMAIGAIISTSLYMALLIGTIVYAAWLLAQNAHSEDEVFSSEKRPLVTSLLELYIRKSSLSNIRRLEAVDDPVIVSGLQEGELDMLKSLAHPSLFPEGKPMEQLPEKHNGGEDPVATFGSRRSHQSERKGKVSSPHDRGEKLVRMSQQKAQEMIDESENLNPTVLRQGMQSLLDIRFTKGDMECLARIVQPSMEQSNTVHRFESLLDWGLFCGYTHYSVAMLRKWPISCEYDCHFNLMHFSHIRNDNQKAVENAYKAADVFKAMTTEQKQYCTLLATVTACRLEESHLAYGAMGAMCLALILSLCLLCFGIKCLLDCVEVVQDENQKTRA